MDILQKLMIDLEELKPEDYINQEPKKVNKHDYKKGFNTAIGLSAALIDNEIEEYEIERLKIKNHNKSMLIYIYIYINVFKYSNMDNID